MNLSNLLKSASILKSLKLNSNVEITLFALFIVFLVFPIRTPELLYNLLDSPLGNILVICATILLFVFTSPILGILYVFVVAESIRRGASVAGSSLAQPEKISPSTSFIEYTPTEQVRTAQIQEMAQPPKDSTLEEDVIGVMAPIGKSEASAYVETTFKPVAEDTHNAIVA
jgi:hypothetical protein